jgi:MFS superfamily sulfate permease-like transporter
MDYKNKYIKYKYKYLNLLKEYKLSIGGNDEKIDNLLEEKLLNINKDIGVINFKFINDIINKRITYKIINNMIFFNINTVDYYRMSIQNNTLSIPGKSIYLDNIYNDEWDTGTIHKMFDNKQIIVKHIIDTPFNNNVKGVLLSDLLHYLKLTNINTQKFGIIINLTNKNYLEKIEEKKKINENPLINVDVNSDQLYLDNIEDISYMNKI